MLISLIMALGEPDSEIFIRYYYYEQKIKHIAKYTGIPISTVKTKLVRGRAELKKSYEKERYRYEQTFTFVENKNWRERSRFC